MNAPPLSIVIFGLSITSSWGNGHATTYRGLVRALAERGHRVTFLERDVPWYRDNRDLPAPPWGRTILYDGLAALTGFRPLLQGADLVIVGSYVPEAVEVGRIVQTQSGLTAFYDIDTPITLAALDRGQATYISPELIPGYDVYLSFTGGPALEILEQRWRAPRAEALYCAADPESYRPLEEAPRWDLGYLGTYSPDRQPSLERLLLEPARAWPEGRFVVAGPNYPAEIAWPENVERIDHLPPADHAAFYARQRFTLNLTRQDMRAIGWSPSIRLFEAASCAAPIISDRWEGLEAVFEPEREILLVDEGRTVLRILKEMPDDRRRAIGRAARLRASADHTPGRRAELIERLVAELGAARAPDDALTRRAL